MTAPEAPEGSAGGDVVRAVVFDDAVAADRAVVAELRSRPDVVVLDERGSQRAELARVTPTPQAAVLQDPGRWVYYPWRRTLVGVLAPTGFHLLRTDRNRNKITTVEQARLGALRIGVVGLSVGHAIAHTLALEGLCGQLRLADFDTLELSNLNRIPATLLDLGVNKAVIAARRIAELDPYLEVAVVQDGLTPQNLPAFLDGLDILVEECDSLDMKLLLRTGARERGIPVLMQTSDGGLLDVERFDLEPDRALFHGLLGDLRPEQVSGLSTKDKVPHVLRILDAPALTARMAASMAEVGQSLSTWPQLGGDVALGGAMIAAAVRQLGLGRSLPSGRVRMDLEEHLERLAAPLVGDAHVVDDDEPAPASARSHAAADAVLEAVRRAPSGGNVQPWLVQVDPGTVDHGTVRLRLAAERTSAMDVEHRGSYVALGAALYNARVAAAAHGVLGPVTLFPDPAEAGLVAELRLCEGFDEALAQHHGAVLERMTNRSHGRPRPLTAEARVALVDAAAGEGGRLHLVDPGAAMTAAGEVLGAADRIRYLTPVLHREMFAELSWPGRDRLDVGVDVRTLGLDAADLATLQIARRPEVMALLAQWGAGGALGDDVRDRVASSSALAVVTMGGSSPADYVRGGSAAEAVWVRAAEHGLAVHPVSPVFLYATGQQDLLGLSSPFATELAELQGAFRSAVGLGTETLALVMRLSHVSTGAVRSRRRPLSELRWSR
jgi:molybdopterin/thiamine biosynthesis adenylyltransferase